MLPWLLLLIAGLFEIGWAISMKMTEGFTKIVPIVCMAAAGGMSLWVELDEPVSTPLGCGGWRK